MKVTTKRILPFVFVVVAVFYLIFSFSLEQRRMIGDEKGWDPGSRAMPISTGFLLLGLSIYLTFKEGNSTKDEEESLDPGPVKLISLTITLAIFYILCFRYVGFILSTNILLFTLIYFNYRQDITWRMLPTFLAGIIASSGFILLVYSIGRYITRFLFLMGKRSHVQILTNRLFFTGITFIFLAIIFLLTLFIVKRIFKKEHTRIFFTSVYIATGVTEFLYLVFKQIFWVSLAKGVIFW